MSSPGSKDKPAGDARAALVDLEALRRLRGETFQTVGPEHGQNILYSLGFQEGLVDGLRVARGMLSMGGEGAVAQGPPTGLLFQPEGPCLQNQFKGCLSGSLEAQVHRQEFPEADSPVCFLSAGYAAGWYSALLDQDVLVREVECQGCGATACRFEARPASEWMANAEHWVAELLPYLDIESMRERAEARSFAQNEGEQEPDGDMLGGFDSMSPAVHVWGPVMVLPYSGPEDGMIAFDAVCEDVGLDQIRVVVVDVTGAMIDASEAVGLTRLVDALDAQALETVVVGMGDEGASYFQGQEPAAQNLVMARDISEAIAVGFQISHSPRFFQ